jgi:hypothetical protein
MVITIWNKPTIKQLMKVPDLYSTEKVKDKKIYLKFFMGAMTWYIAEIDHKGWDTMYGYVYNASDPEMSEWGYSSLKELLGLRVGYVEVDRELHGITPLTPKKFSEIRVGQ